MISPGSETIVEVFQNLQDDICRHLEEMDGSASFHQDLWKRQEGGGGRTRIISGLNIEKGGVNFSEIYGAMPDNIRIALKLEPNHFLATGVSIVLHARNPWVPIIHMNVRYFETNTGHWWFGGGIDVTPHYINIAQASSFHNELKRVCDQLAPECYPRYKKWADDYFYNNHRGETRGIGGIFFDHLNEDSGFKREDIWEFVQRVGNAFIPCYRALFMFNNHMPFSDEDLKWQSIRRGRYVEFNLVYDKGTKFGLQTNGRIESILMSLPPVAHWNYDFSPPNENALRTQGLLRKDIDWLNYNEA